MGSLYALRPPSVGRAAVKISAGQLSALKPQSQENQERHISDYQEMRWLARRYQAGASRRPAFRPPAAHPCLDGCWRAGGPQGRPATQRLTPALRFGGRAAVGRRVAGLSSF